ncbi:5999_t:CDS:2 [Diversispora eburnea]|uniref:5999_t:CDS:1 n=1 Tax=Diversispora eburnea TaxID=1213867 RepID=A0A9N9AAS1_9GLOM|nr:5999_t:CDS:2 [Diversispora eburnea]
MSISYKNLHILKPIVMNNTSKNLYKSYNDSDSNRPQFVLNMSFDL